MQGKAAGIDQRVLSDSDREPWYKGEGIEREKTDNLPDFYF